MLLADTPKKRARRKSTREKTGRTQRRRRMERKRKRKRENGQRDEDSLPSEIRHHTAVTSFRGRDPLCHVSVRQQPVWSESDTTSLNIPRGATCTLSGLWEKQDTSHVLNHHQCPFFFKWAVKTVNDIRRAKKKHKLESESSVESVIKLKKSVFRSLLCHY